MPYYFIYLVAILLPAPVFSQLTDSATQQSNALLISLDAATTGLTTLSWKNDLDITSGFFVVERRSDSGSFEPMVTLKVSLQSFNYKVSDEKPFPGINYYRIKIVQDDGLFSYSPIVSGDMSLLSFCRFYPNPADDHLIISAKKQLEIRIFNRSGVLSLTKAVNKGLTALDLTSLSKGIYILTAESTDTKTTMRHILYKN